MQSRTGCGDVVLSVDALQMYFTESETGEAIKNAGAERNSVWVTTKGELDQSRIVDYQSDSSTVSASSSEQPALEETC